MLRNDRHDHGGECVADSYADSHTYADGYTCGDGHTHADGYACGDGHTYANSYANGHTDAVHWKMFTDAEAGSDSGAASHATRSDSCHVHERHAWGSYGCSS
jgi:hypothetical protein